MTPPDVVSQLVLAMPMCILYEIGIFVARLVEQAPQGAASRTVGRPTGE